MAVLPPRVLVIACLPMLGGAVLGALLAIILGTIIITLVLTR